MELDIDAILLGQANHQVTAYPQVVADLLGTLTEDLPFPLTLSHFGVDAFEVNASVQSDVDVLFDDLASHVTDVLVANTGVVRALRSWIAFGWEA